jgi:FKBP-type peptidyl-prolyl cis-trans isomerase
MKRIGWGLLLLLAGCMAGNGGTEARPGVTAPSGLRYQDVVVGEGETARPGDRVFVHYTGRLTDGTKFDSSLDHGQPIDFVLGRGQVISGWDEGIAGMKVGGKRKLMIPSQLAYKGEEQRDPRGNVDVELVKVLPPPR